MRERKPRGLDQRDRTELFRWQREKTPGELRLIALRLNRMADGMEEKSA